MGVDKDKVKEQIDFLYEEFVWNDRLFPFAWMSDWRLGMLREIAHSLERLRDENETLKEREKELEEQLEDSEGESDFFLSQSREAYGALNEITSIIDRLNEDEE